MRVSCARDNEKERCQRKTDLARCLNASNVGRLVLAKPAVLVLELTVERLDALSSLPEVALSKGSSSVSSFLARERKETRLTSIAAL